jgi:stage III sporulation protein AD
MFADVLKVVGVGVAAAILLSLLRRERPEMAVILSLGAGLALLIYVLPSIGQVTTLLGALSTRAHVRLLYFDNVLRIIGIAYLAEFGAHVARDAGETAIAAKVELAAKVLILVLALPIVSAILDLVLKLL